MRDDAGTQWVRLALDRHGDHSRLGMADGRLPAEGKQSTIRLTAGIVEALAAVLAAFSYLALDGQRSEGIWLQKSHQSA